MPRQTLFWSALALLLAAAAATEAPRIELVLAFNPSNDYVYGVGDTMSIAFDMPTNKAGGHRFETKAQVDALVQANQNLGSDYSAKWSDAQSLVITVVNPTGASPPQTGVLQFTVVSEELRSLDGLSPPSRSESPPILGSFAVAPLVVAAVAGNPPNDFGYGRGDTITFVFDMPTNRARRASLPTKADVDAIVWSSMALGDDYSGAWLNASALQITVLDAGAALDPSAAEFEVMVKNADETSETTTEPSPPMTGAFGLDPALVVTSLQPASVVVDSKITFRLGTVKEGLDRALRISFATAGNCASKQATAGHLFETVIAHEQRVTAPTLVHTVGEFRVCFSHNSGRSWTEQTTPGVKLAVLSTAPQFVSVVASNPSGDFSYGAGDTVSLVFDQPTDQQGLLTSRAQVESLLHPSQALGDGYSGQWISPTQLVLTVTDAAGAAPPKIGELTFTVVGPLRNQDQSSSPSSATSPPISGTFSEPPGIVAVVAGNPSGDFSYGAGDTLTVLFNTPTNRGHATQLPSKDTVDALLQPSQSLGTDYSAAWRNDSALVISVQNAKGAHPPQVGAFSFTVVGDLRTVDGTSARSTATSPPLIGAFSEAPSFVSAVAGNPGGRLEYGRGNVVTLTFNAATDQAGGASLGSRADVDALVLPSQALGADYSAEWRNPSTLVVTVVDASGAAPPQIGKLYFSVVGDLQNEDRTCRSAAVSPPVTGSFARPPSIVSVTASNPPMDFKYGEGDVITLSFDQPTDAGAARATLPSKEAVDAVVAASERLGAEYSAEWTSGTLLEITVLNSVGAAPPRIGSLSFAVVGDLQNLARTSGASRSTSPPVEGVFAQPPGFKSVIAANPSADFEYGATDTITLTFTTPTDRAGVDTLRDRSAVNALVQPSVDLGAAYSAAWTNSLTLVIRVTDATGVQPPQVSQLTFTVVGDLRTLDRTSAPSTATSAPATGVFARAPGFLAVTAGNPLDDSHYAVGDTVLVQFNTDTDKAGDLHSRAAVDALLEPSQPLGTEYSATWQTPSALLITIVDARGALPPQVGVLTFTARGDIRNAQQSSAACAETSMPLAGAFARAPRFTSATAANPQGDSLYSTGDVVTLVFDSPTDRGGHPSLPHKAAVDALVLPSQSLGAAYSGEWMDDATLVIEILDPSRAAPPQIDVLKFQVVGALRRKDLTSGASRATSPALQGAFARAPEIVSAVAANPPKDHHYGEGDTITLSFSAPTNRHEDLPNKAAVDALVRCSDRLGAAYSGAWHSPSELEIRVLEPVRPAKNGPRIGNTTCTIVGPLRKEDLTSALSSSTSPPLQGVFAEPPAVVVFEAGNPLQLDEFGVGATLTLGFDCDTDVAGHQALKDKASVDTLLAFSHRIGADYTAKWIDPATLVVTVRDAATAAPPRIGHLTVAVRPEGALRTADGSSEPCAAASGPVWGSFAKVPAVVSVVARNPMRDSVYGIGDTITVQFDRDTNMGAGGAQRQLHNRAAVNDLVQSSQRLGTAYSAAWRSPSTLVITIQDPRQAHPPAIGELVLTLRGIGNAAGTSAAETVEAPPIVGAFVRAPEFLSVVARNVRDSDDEYGPGDTITLVFDTDTNEAPSRTLKDKEVVDSLLQASMDLGAAYSAEWVNRRTLVIEIQDATGAEPPQAGVLRFTALAGAGLRTAKLTSFPSRDTSPRCTGKFAASDRPPAPTRSSSSSSSDLLAEDCPPVEALPCEPVAGAADAPWSLLGMLAAMVLLVPGLLLLQYVQWRLAEQLRLRSQTFFQLLWPALVAELLLWKVYCDHFELGLSAHLPHLYALFLSSLLLTLALLSLMARVADDGLHVSSAHPKWEVVAVIVLCSTAVSWQFALHRWGWTLLAVVLYVNFDFPMQQTLQTLRRFYAADELADLQHDGLPLRDLSALLQSGALENCKPSVGALLDLQEEGVCAPVLRTVSATGQRMTGEDQRVAREFRSIFERCVARCHNTRTQFISGLEFKMLCGQADSSLSGEEFSRCLQMCVGREDDDDRELAEAVSQWWHGPEMAAEAGDQLSMVRNGRLPDEHRAMWPVGVLTVDQVLALYRMRASRRESLFVALFAELRESVCLAVPEARWCESTRSPSPGAAAAASAPSPRPVAPLSSLSDLGSPAVRFQGLHTPRGARADPPMAAAATTGGPGLRRRPPAPGTL